MEEKVEQIVLMMGVMIKRIWGLPLILILIWNVLLRKVKVYQRDKGIIGYQRENHLTTTNLTTIQRVSEDPSHGQ